MMKWRVTFWVPGSSLERVALVPGESRGQAVYTFECDHQAAVILDVRRA